MNQLLVKKFILNYLEGNSIRFEVDENNIYTIYFEDVLANKLGKIRKFTFNREVSEDYGVDYISLHNDITKFILRDSLEKGQVVKAVLEFPVEFKDKLNLPKTVLITKQKKDQRIGICFMFKISSTNVHENQPEILKFVIVDYEKSIIFPEAVASEFHNFKFSKANFKFSPESIVKAHSVAYENLEKQLKIKYMEHGIVNKAFLDEQINEIQKRHDDLVKELKSAVSSQEERCKAWKNRIKSSQSYKTRVNYEKSLNATRQKLEDLQLENEKKINLHFTQTQIRIDDLKKQSNFDVNVYLEAAIVFQYNVLELSLIENNSNEEAYVIFNTLTKSIQEYNCQTCGTMGQKINISINGHFCCPSCSTYQEKDKGYLCKKDNVEKCMITGNFIKKEEENKCLACNRYFDLELLKLDVVGKKTCPLCLIKTYFGGMINKKDAVFSKKYKSCFKPSDVKKCELSNDYYPLSDISITTGSGKLVANEFIKKCKYTNLTFVKDEMKDDRTSKFVFNLKEKNTKDLKYKLLQEEIKKNVVEFNENQLWAVVKIKGLLREKYILYDKKRKEIVK
jgi:hypothetical protein